MSIATKKNKNTASTPRKGVIKTLHVVFASHLDIGYTGSPERTALDHKENLDAVLKLCRKHPDFRYMVETTWILRQWLDRTDDPREVDEMRKLIRKGQIEVGGLFATPHSSVCGPEDLNQYTYEARRLREELGIRIDTAIQCDVPGYCWAYPQILSKSGIRYMFTGLNTGLGGGIEGIKSNHPFYWEGVDGSRILLYVQDNYGGNPDWNVPWLFSRSMHSTTDTMETAKEQVRAIVEKMENAGFAYDTALQFCSEGDNQGPDSHSHVVYQRIKEWNAAGNEPRIEVSTLGRYFEYMEKKYGKTLPVVRGDWPAAYEWDLVKVRGPIGTTGYREAQAQLPTAEKLLALDEILQKRSFPRADVEDTWNQLRLYDEHSSPESEAVWLLLSRNDLQWLHLAHYNYARSAWNQTRMLLRQGMVQFRRWTSKDDVIVVFNPLWWKRDDLVRVPLVFRDKNDKHHFYARSIVDIESGETIPCDNMTTGSLGGDGRDGSRQPCITFVARNVPAMGYRVFQVVPEEGAPKRKAAKKKAADRNVIENERYRVRVDARGQGIASIYDKALRRELVSDITVAAGKTKSRKVLLNGFVSESELGSRSVKITRVEGETFQKIEIRRPGTWFPETDVRLTLGSDQVEVRNVFDRAAWKKQYPEAARCDIRLQFPFRLSAKQSGTVVSGPTGFRRVPEDLAAGTPGDTWSSSAFLALHDDKTTVLISSPVDYFFMPGERKGQTVAVQTQTVWQRYDLTSISDGAEVFDYTEPQESDEIVRSYAISSHAGKFDATRATRFGWAYRTPMVGRCLQKRVATKGLDYKTFLEGRELRRREIAGENPKEFTFTKAAQSLISVGDRDVAVLALRRSLFAGQDCFILRLQEMAGRSARKVTVRFAPSLALASAAEASMTEDKGKGIKVANNAFETTISAFETATFAIAFRK